MTSENLQCGDIDTGFSLTPYLESFTPTFGLGTPVFPRISSNLHCGTPTFSKGCLWDSYFQNPSENPVDIKVITGNVENISKSGEAELVNAVLNYIQETQSFVN